MPEVVDLVRRKVPEAADTSPEAIRARVSIVVGDDGGFTAGVSLVIVF